MNVMTNQNLFVIRSLNGNICSVGRNLVSFGVQLNFLDWKMSWLLNRLSAAEILTYQHTLVDIYRPWPVWSPCTTCRIHLQAEFYLADSCSQNLDTWKKIHCKKVI
jgi:hypothetical protein